MNDRIMVEILAAHADKLNKGQRGTAGLPYPAYSQLPSVWPLLHIAERVQSALVPVQPDPAFVRQLGKQLVTVTSESRKATTVRTRKAVVVGAAVLGSAVSLASAIGVVIYLIRHRGRLRPSSA